MDHEGCGMLLELFVKIFNHQILCEYCYRDIFLNQVNPTYHLPNTKAGFFYKITGACFFFSLAFLIPCLALCETGSQVRAIPAIYCKFSVLVLSS